MTASGRELPDRSGASALKADTYPRRPLSGYPERELTTPCRQRSLFPRSRRNGVDASPERRRIARKRHSGASGCQLSGGRTTTVAPEVGKGLPELGARAVANRSGCGATTVAMFILVRQVRVPRCLYVECTSEFWTPRLPVLIERHKGKDELAPATMERKVSSLGFLVRH